MERTSVGSEFAESFGLNIFKISKRLLLKQRYQSTLLEQNLKLKDRQIDPFGSALADSTWGIFREVFWFHGNLQRKFLWRVYSYSDVRQPVDDTPLLTIFVIVPRCVHRNHISFPREHLVLTHLLDFRDTFFTGDFCFLKLLLFSFVIKR